MARVGSSISGVGSSVCSSSPSSSWVPPLRSLGPCTHRSLVVSRRHWPAALTASRGKQRAQRCSVSAIDPPALLDPQRTGREDGQGAPPPQAEEWSQEAVQQQQQQPVQEAAQQLSDDGAGAGAQAVRRRWKGLDEKELERRTRISAANTGKQPWNKGRKHSPETIAKIRERTKAAMARPDVVSNYKEGVAKHRQKVAEELELHPPPPKPVKERKPRARKTPADWAETADASSGDAPTAPRRRQRQAAGQEAGNADPGAAGNTTDAAAGASHEQAAPAEPRPPRQRKPPSEAHRRAIADAIRAKWQDPEYRQRAVEGIHQNVVARTGREVGASRPRRSTASTSPRSSSSGAAPGGAASSSASSAAAAGRQAASREAAAERRAREAMLAQVQVVVDQIVATRKLIMRVDMEIAAMRVKAQAFVHDPGMAGRAEAQVAQAESMLNVARTKLRLLQDQLPPGIRFDTTGRIAVSDLMNWTPAATATTTATAGVGGGRGQHQHQEDGQGGEQQRPPRSAASLLADLDPEAMRDPLHSVPDVPGLAGYSNGHSHSGGSNGHHLPGAPHVNGTQLRANGHQQHSDSSSSSSSSSSSTWQSNGSGQARHAMVNGTANGYHANVHHHPSSTTTSTNDDRDAPVPQLMLRLSAAELLPQPPQEEEEDPDPKHAAGSREVQAAIAAAQEEPGAAAAADPDPKRSAALEAGRSPRAATRATASSRRGSSRRSSSGQVAMGTGDDGEDLVRSTRSVRGTA